MRSIEVTHSPFLREAWIDSGASILNFGLARNLFSEFKSMTGLQRLPGFGTRNSRLESQAVLCMHNFDGAFEKQVLNRGQQGTLFFGACVTAGDSRHPAWPDLGTL